MSNSQTVVPIQSADLDRVEVAWFAPLCSDDYRYLGVPDGQLRSNWQNTSEVLLTAEKLGFGNILCPSSYQVGQDTLTFASGVAPLTSQINVLTAIRCGDVVEDAINQFILNNFSDRANQESFKREVSTIGTLFNSTWRAVVDAPHHDEFLICTNKPGMIHSYHGMMCVSFDLFAKYHLKHESSEPIDVNILIKSETSQLLPAEISANNNISPILFSPQADGSPASAPSESIVTSASSSPQTAPQSASSAPQSAGTTPGNDTNATGSRRRQSTTTPRDTQPPQRKGVSFWYIFLSIITLGLYPLILFIMQKMKSPSRAKTAERVSPVTTHTKNSPRQSNDLLNQQGPRWYMRRHMEYLHNMDTRRANLNSLLSHFQV